MKNWYTIRARGQATEVLIYDEIGAFGISAKGFLAELGALPDNAPIDLRLNSPGGSVFDAVAIYNALQRHEGPVTVWIDGIAASAASYVAMAGDEIVMPENAFLMIHDPSGLVMGTAADMREMADTLDKIAGTMVRGYAARSGRSEDEITALMAAETWFDATAALEAGFATRMIEPVRIAASFDIGRFRNAPPALAEAIADPAPESDQEGNEAAEDAIGDEIGDEAPATPDEPKPEPSTLAGPGPVVTGMDPIAIRRDAIAHARAIVDLCRLAGQPQMAGRFLDEDASLETVRTSLLGARADAEADISPHHPQPGPSPTTRPWGDVIARTFKLKG
ncbi:head maturation protease, ClpP-related [Pannonibacter carbonis]|uniref:head maturation protease, ClpP-related n=1 Tax=Pannonibacter carbonis TaxID=2067569 RepID=UPI0013002F2D|nr:head maturation protease, ClpP-related [Pannonibacter carbonis]